MLIGFGLLVWLPAPFADPHKLINWAGNAENLAIAGAAWIVADFLADTIPPGNASAEQLVQFSWLAHRRHTQMGNGQENPSSSSI
jgi:hypothetical protein